MQFRSRDGIDWQLVSVPDVLIDGPDSAVLYDAVHPIADIDLSHNVHVRSDLSALPG